MKYVGNPLKSHATTPQAIITKNTITSLSYRINLVSPAINDIVNKTNITALANHCPVSQKYTNAIHADAIKSPITEFSL